MFIYSVRSIRFIDIIQNILIYTSYWTEMFKIGLIFSSKKIFLVYFKELFIVTIKI